MDLELENAFEHKEMHLEDKFTDLLKKLNQRENDVHDLTEILDRKTKDFETYLTNMINYEK